jgi:hypothetical protein
MHARMPRRAEVKLLRWPAESARRARYKAMGVLRLLVIEGGAPAPITSDIREDWVRAPITDADLRARMATLRAKADAHWQPEIDPDGILRFAGRSTTVSPTETDMLECLIRQFGSLVSREALRECLPERSGGVSRNALDLHIMRLRRRIQPIGLVIRTLRGRGYLLESAEGPSGPIGAVEPPPAPERPRRTPRRGSMPAAEVAKLRWARDRRIAAG